jgi:hypothetical protein
MTPVSVFPSNVYQFDMVSMPYYERRKFTFKYFLSATKSLLVVRQGVQATPSDLRMRRADLRRSQLTI